MTANPKPLGVVVRRMEFDDDTHPYAELALIQWPDGTRQWFQPQNNHAAERDAWRELAEAALIYAPDPTASSFAPTARLIAARRAVEALP